jgi:hypothetical protein
MNYDRGMDLELTQAPAFGQSMTACERSKIRCSLYVIQTAESKSKNNRCDLCTTIVENFRGLRKFLSRKTRIPLLSIRATNYEPKKISRGVPAEGVEMTTSFFAYFAFSAVNFSLRISLLLLYTFTL